MKQIIFENHRKEKVPLSEMISVITLDGTIENGWTNGRSLYEINADFGTKDVDWFFFRYMAEAYKVQHKNKYVKAKNDTKQNIQKK